MAIHSCSYKSTLHLRTIDESDVFRGTLQESAEGEEGKKRFFGRWKASHPIDLYEYAKRYRDMEPEEILHEIDGNYFRENSEIDSIEFTTIIFYTVNLGER